MRENEIYCPIKENDSFFTDTDAADFCRDKVNFGCFLHEPFGALFHRPWNIQCRKSQEQSACGFASRCEKILHKNVPNVRGASNWNVLKLLLLMKFILHLIEICKQHSYVNTEYQVFVRPFLSSSVWQKFFVTSATVTTRNELHIYMQMIIVARTPYTFNVFYQFNAMQSNVIQGNNEILLFSSLTRSVNAQTKARRNNKFEQLKPLDSLQTTYRIAEVSPRVLLSSAFHLYMKEMTTYALHPFHFKFIFAFHY